MLNKKVQDAINDQINAELYSAYLYLSMSAWCEDNGLAGFANWMKVQYEEETFHAMKMFGYVHERGGRVYLKQIDTPPADWKNIIEVVEEVYAHEQKVTGLIHALVEVAAAEKDHASVNFLQWYVDEQVEEEASVTTMLDELKMVEGKGSGLFMMDREAKARTFTTPAGE